MNSIGRWGPGAPSPAATAPPSAPPGTTPGSRLGALRRRGVRSSVAVAVSVGSLYLALAGTCAINALGWVGATFPGFFVMRNRVVPSAALSHWTGARASIYHWAVLEVDGVPVVDTSEVYARVRASAPGTSIQYVFGRGAERRERAIPSMVFRVDDYVWLFLPYLLNGLLFAAAGLVVWALQPYRRPSWAMLALGCCLGMFAITGTDLYGPHWFFRLHLAAEAFLPATLLHLALVFPKPRLGRRWWWPLLLVYAPSVALATAHELAHFVPTTYSLIYKLCSVFLGTAALTVILAIATAHRRTGSQLVRQRVRVLLVGTTVAAAPAAVVIGASGLSGGEVPVNAAAFSALAFPLTLAYAIIKHDLFAIDAFIKRAIYYGVLTGTVFAVYVLLIAVVGVAVRPAGSLGNVIYALALAVAVVALFEPVKARVRTFVDRVCFRRAYQPETVLNATSLALATTSDLDDVLDILLTTICGELQIEHAHAYLRERGGELRLCRRRGSSRDTADLPQTIPIDDPVVDGVTRMDRASSAYDVRAGDAGEAPGRDPDLFTRLGARLLLPLRFQGRLVGLVALGPKRSGKFYSAADVDFLGTLGAQSVVSILHAMAYRRIEALNRELEGKVALRTRELARANEDLRESLEERERAYVELERRQQQLLHAEKMAALGRLTAGIAHEISTPLGAALSALKVVEDVAQECRAALGGPTVEVADLREMAEELVDVSAEVRTSTQKAARFVRSIKLYALGREELCEREFMLHDVITEACQLVARKLRLIGCVVQLEIAEGTPPLFGDPARLAQVITNLVTNAADAYEEAGGGGVIRITVGAEAGAGEVVIRVSDDAGGIRPEHLPHIFEELFSTKPPGLGTGLGLPISRSIVTDCFHGSIVVDSTHGRGTTFTIRFPPRRLAAPAEAAATT